MSKFSKPTAVHLLYKPQILDFLSFRNQKINISFPFIYLLHDAHEQMFFINRCAQLREQWKLERDQIQQLMLV